MHFAITLGTLRSNDGHFDAPMDATAAVKDRLCAQRLHLTWTQSGPIYKSKPLLLQIDAITVLSPI